MARREETSPSITPDSTQHAGKFIADAMLGRLARWLRFLGFDTAYSPGINDRSLIRIAREQDRTILTRDTHLVKIKGLKSYLLIVSDDPFQQLLETISTFKLKQFQFLSRCVACNGNLEKVADKSEVKDSVPEYVFLHYDLFRKCADCGKIYWQGTHPKKFREDIREILGDS
jgi:uncharacterized protein with PIN domain